ncbi:MAG: pre-mycofactocin synthase MftD [Ilumatobacteraceae bacterium]|jgi:heme/flavin dehydrogenase (mycofactocin system)
MANPWFESVAVAQRRAKRILPWYVYDALIAGSEAGLTLDDNQAAFREIGFQPVVADRPSERHLATSALGMDLSMPVMISPTGVQAVHPDGEVAVARAAAARGTAVGLSSFGSKPMEEVAAANPQFAFQMYWINDRDWIAGQMERARAAGAKAVILTLDWSFSHSRDWGSPPLPERIDLRTMVKYAPAVIVRPTWLLRYLRSGTLPDLSTPNMTVDGGPAPTFFGAYGQWMGTPQPTWVDLAWFAGQWGGPCLLKGVMRVDDARRARDAGFSAISVSNHGGNNLDGTPSPLRALPAIAAAVGSDIEVLLDGGVRRGADVVKAVALGARAVMIGRAYLWGLAANGQAGVENVLDILRMGIDSSLLGMGVASIHDVRREHLLVPDGFERPLGAG